MSARSPILVLMSGGIDSAACAHFLSRNGGSVSGVFFDFGQAGRSPEETAVRRMADHLNVPLEVVRLPTSGERGAGEQFGRNAFFVLAAAFLLRHRRGMIAMGVHAGVPYYDCSEPFVTRLDTLLSELSDGELRLIAPFASWRKAQIVEYFLFEKLPLELTYSCEAGDSPPCGECASCLDRMALGLG